MEEKKKKKVELPTIQDVTSGEVRDLQVVSCLFSEHKHNRFAHIMKTEADTYAIFLHRSVEGEEDIHQELYMSKDGFADLCCSLLAFLGRDGVGDFRGMFADYADGDFQWSYVKHGDEVEEDDE